MDLVPSEFVFEPRSPRYGPFLVLGSRCTLRSFWGFLAPFWAVSRTYSFVYDVDDEMGASRGPEKHPCLYDASGGF